MYHARAFDGFGIILTMRFLSIAVVALASALSAGADGSVIRSVAELKVVYDRGQRGEYPFELTGTVIDGDGKIRTNFLLMDETGREPLVFEQPHHLPAGSVGQAVGKAFIGSDREHWTLVTDFIVRGRTNTPPALTRPLVELDGSRYEYHLVRTEGTVVDAFTDEVDSKARFLLLQDGETVLPVHLNIDESSPTPDLIDARIRVTGFFNRTIYGGRKFSGPYINVSPANIEILTPAPLDPFDHPVLEDIKYLSPREVTRLGKRTVTGRVLAVWSRRFIMLAADDGRIVNVELLQGIPLPEVNAAITVVGQPETDLFRLNLSRARFRNSPDAQRPPTGESPRKVTLKELFSDSRGRDYLNHLYHGQLLHIRGTVRKLPSPDGLGGLTLESDGYAISANVPFAQTGDDSVRIGSEIEVVGRCLVESENWRPDNIFPHLHGISLIVRGPADVRILRQPPWWTPTRLWSAIGALLAVLIAILVWNVSLRKAVEHRSRLLLKEQIAHVSSELRVDERTRLAVELHDSLSQTLTGVALEINAADRAADEDTPSAHRHLDIAAKSLRSCHAELRNCLWDLRNDALGVPDMNDAIRQTLAPHLGDARLVVRFNVPRERFSDNTAHAILRIIRELASNAVRHGMASVIRVAGSIEDHTLRFSVADDGTGFDVTNHPSTAQGHFGLQGIRERVASLDGEFRIRSQAGAGAKATISIQLPECKETAS